MALLEKTKVTEGLRIGIRSFFPKEGAALINAGCTHMPLDWPIVLFLSYLTASPLSVLSESPNRRVTKWEKTSCFKNSVFSSIGSSVNGPDVAFCGQCYALSEV